MILIRCVDPVGVNDIYSVDVLSVISYNTTVVLFVVFVFVAWLMVNLAYRIIRRKPPTYYKLVSYFILVMTLVAANGVIIARIWYRKKFYNYGINLVWLAIASVILLMMNDYAYVQLKRSVTVAYEAQRLKKNRHRPTSSASDVMARADQEKSSSYLQSSKNGSQSLMIERSQSQSQSQSQYVSSIELEKSQELYIKMSNLERDASEHLQRHSSNHSSHKGGESSTDLNNHTSSSVDLVHGPVPEPPAVMHPDHPSSRRHGSRKSKREGEERIKQKALRSSTGKKRSKARRNRSGRAKDVVAASHRNIDRSLRTLGRTLIVYHFLAAISIYFQLSLAVKSLDEEPLHHPPKDNYSAKDSFFLYIHTVSAIIILWYAYVPLGVLALPSRARLPKSDSQQKNLNRKIRNRSRSPNSRSHSSRSKSRSRFSSEDEDSAGSNRSYSRRSSYSQRRSNSPSRRYAYGGHNKASVGAAMEARRGSEDGDIV